MKRAAAVLVWSEKSELLPTPRNRLQMMPRQMILSTRREDRNMPSW